jgi:flagellin-like protein
MLLPFHKVVGGDNAMFKEKRAVTPVIATLLLIAITVAAVAGFYIFYSSFIGQSKVSSQEPAVSLFGPTMSYEGDTVTLTIKNSGNVEIVSLNITDDPSMTFVPSTWASQITSGNPLKVGGSVACAVQLPVTTTDWTVTVTGGTGGGASVVDVWVIEEY